MLSSILRASFILSAAALVVLPGCEPASETSGGAAAANTSGRAAPGVTASNAPVGVKVGNRAPDWVLRDGEGNTHRLSDYVGQVVVMDFWATWCGPCRRAMPGMQHLHETYADRGVVVLGMNGSERPGGDPIGFMQRSGYTYTTILNCEKIAPTYRVRSIPTFYVVGVDGTIIHHQVGLSTAGEQQLVSLIEAHLEQHGM
jgi:thiol-disulfide isomerase/thioredoxin